MQSVPCTRWKELQLTVHYQAKSAGILGTNTNFRLMNKFDKEFMIANTMEDVNGDVLKVQKGISKAHPCGTTPRIEHIILLYARISVIAPELKARNQKVACIFVADGLPTDATGRTHPAFIQIFHCSVAETPNTSRVDRFSHLLGR